MPLQTSISAFAAPVESARRYERSVVIGLGYLGSRPPEGGYVITARILTAYYFVFLLVILPLLGLFETTKPLPNSISESVLREGLPAGASAPPPSGAKA